MHAPTQIICPDCGGVCGLLGDPGPDVEFTRGEVVAYRCADCLDRWDVVLEDDDETEDV